MEGRWPVLIHLSTKPVQILKKCSAGLRAGDSDHFHTLQPIQWPPSFGVMEKPHESRPVQKGCCIPSATSCFPLFSNIFLHFYTLICISERTIYMHIILWFKAGFITLKLCSLYRQATHWAALLIVQDHLWHAALTGLSTLILISNIYYTATDPFPPDTGQEYHHPCRKHSHHNEINLSLQIMLYWFAVTLTTKENHVSKLPPFSLDWRVSFSCYSSGSGLLWRVAYTIVI